MKREQANVAGVLRKGLPSPSSEEMTADCNRVLQALWPAAEPLRIESRAASSSSQAFQARQARQARQSLLSWRWAGGLSALSILLLGTALFMTRRVDAFAVVESAEGSLYRVHSGEQAGIAAGAHLRSGDSLRTDNGAVAMVALADGSRVELKARSEVVFDRSDDGVRLRLDQGGLIVNAATQQAGHLYVQTRDVLVSVLGTVFLVNAEAEGSRIAVFEGNVQVQQGAGQKQLGPGDQLATNPRMPALSVEEEISWSRNREAHLALLQTAQNAAADPRSGPVRQSVRQGVPVAPLTALQVVAASEQRMSWSTNGGIRDIRYQGTHTLTDDARDFASISPAGFFVFSERPPSGSVRSIELRGRADGGIERKYSIDGQVQTSDVDSRAWLNAELPGIVRRTGFAADSHVARMLQQASPSEVLLEISGLETNRVKRLYFTAFIATAKPEGVLLQQTLEQAKRDISSSAEMGQLLIQAVSNRIPANADWDIVLGAVRTIPSSLEQRRVLSAIANGALSPEVLIKLLQASTAIGSSAERASFLVHLVERQKLDGDVRTSFVEAAMQISSESERRRALEALSKDQN